MNDSIAYSPFRWLILISAALGSIAMQVTNLSIAPILPQIAQDLGITAGAATNLMTAFVLSGTVALLFAGILCDRYGVLVVICLGLFCASMPPAVMPWIGSSYHAALWARIFAGLSPAFLLSAMGPIIAIWFPPKEKGLAGGLMAASVSVGSAVGVVAGPALFLATGNWRHMSAWLSLIGWVGLAFALVLLVIPKPQPPNMHRESDGEPETDRLFFKEALFSHVTLIGILVIFFGGWCLHCLYGLTPGFLSADRPLGVGFGPMVSGQLMLAVMVAGIVSPIIGGILTDKVFKGDAKPVLFMGFCFCTVMIYTLQMSAVHTGVLPLLTALILAGMAVQLLYPSLYVYIAKNYQAQVVGKMTGVWSAVGGVGGVFGLFLGGTVVNHFGNYEWAMRLVALAGLAGLLFTLILPKTRE
ncbi:nitrate/nitrite transporter [Thermodesulfobacteriota bacterium]